MGITLSSKPTLTFSKEHQTGACLNYLDSYLSIYKINMSIFRINVMPIGGKGSNLG